MKKTNVILAHLDKTTTEAPRTKLKKKHKRDKTHEFLSYMYAYVYFYRLFSVIYYILHIGIVVGT